MCCTFLEKNLETLLEKLDDPESSATIIKYFNEGKFEQSMDSIQITAIENEQAYENRAPGQMKEDKPEPVTDEDGSIKTFIFTVDGKPFRCGCGCNCFHKLNKLKPNLIVCNSCRIEYESS